jgi:hypothetical protein
MQRKGSSFAHISESIAATRAAGVCVLLCVLEDVRRLLGLGCRSPLVLGLITSRSSSPLYLKRGDVSIKASKRLEGKPSLLSAVGEAPWPAFPAPPPTLAAATILDVNSAHGYYSTAGTVARNPNSHTN